MNGKLVFLETAHGTRYWRITDDLETYGEELVYSAGFFEDVEQAIEAGTIDPEAWSNGDGIEAALGHETYLVDDYKEHLAGAEAEAEAIEDWRNGL